MESLAGLIGRLDSHDEVLRKIAVAGLIKRGSEAVPPLLEALKKGRPHARAGAALALGRISETTPRVILALLERLVDEIDHVRECASTALGSMGVAPLDYLIETLESPHPHVKGWAAVAIGRIGPEAEKAIRPLCMNVVHPDEFVWRQSSIAIGKVTKGSPKGLLNLLHNAWIGGDVRATLVALIALRECGASSPEVGGTVMSVYAQSSNPIKHEACVTFLTLFPVASINDRSMNIPKEVLAAWLLKATTMPRWGSGPRKSKLE